MRKCLRCESEMVDNLVIMVNGGAYGIDVRKKGLFKGSLGDIKCSVCPACGYLETYIDDVSKVKRLESGGLTMKYLSVTQTAEKWGISTRCIQILCNEERIPGAVRIGHSWAIPDDVPKPADARIKSGKYIKKPAENEK